jgi:hypothetical protein
MRHAHQHALAEDLGLAARAARIGGREIDEPVQHRRPWPYWPWIASIGVDSGCHDVPDASRVIA